MWQLHMEYSQFIMGHDQSNVSECMSAHRLLFGENTVR